MTNMTEIFQAADIASRQTDRWLFLCAAIILFVFAGAVIRWLVKELSSSRAAYHTTLRSVIDEQTKLSIDLKLSLDRNTEALRANSRLLETRGNH